MRGALNKSDTVIQKIAVVLYISMGEIQSGINALRI